MPKQHQLRRVTNLAWDKFNQTKTLRMPVDQSYRRIILQFDGSVTVADGSASGAALSEAPYSFMKRIRVKMNSRHVLFDIDGGTLSRINRFDYGTDANATNNVDGAEAVGDTFSGILVLDFSYPKRKTYNPADLFLPADRLVTLEVEIEIGGKTELVTAANDRTFTFVSFDIEFYAGVMEGFAASPGLLLKKVFDQKVDIASNNSRRKTEIPAGNAFRRILVKGEAATDDNNTSFNPSSAVLDQLQIFAGSVEVVHGLEDVIRLAGSLDAQLETNLAGYYMNDFSPDGQLTEILGTEGLRVLDCYTSDVKATNNTNLIFIADEILAFPAA